MRSPEPSRQCAGHATLFLDRSDGLLVRAHGIFEYLDLRDEALSFCFDAAASCVEGADSI